MIARHKIRPRLHGQRLHEHRSSVNKVPLSEMCTEEQGIVVGIHGGWWLRSRLLSLGFSPGVQVSLLQNFGHGPLIACVRGTRIALGRGEAEKILVAICSK